VFWASLTQDFDSAHTVDSPIASADRSGNGSDHSSRRRKKQSSSPRGSNARGASSSAHLQARSHSQPSVELGVDDLSAIPGSFEADYSRSLHGDEDNKDGEAQAAAAVVAMVKSLAANASLPSVVAATCPLTRKPMVHPALLVVDGFTYERSAIEAWLELKRVSPVTGQPASVVDLHSPRKVLEEARRDQSLDARAQVIEAREAGWLYNFSS